MSKKVAVVEDEAELASLIEYNLTRGGFQVHVLNGADSTLRELGQQMDRPFRTSTVDLWVRKLGLTYKKNAPRLRAEPGRRGGAKDSLA